MFAPLSIAASKAAFARLASACASSAALCAVAAFVSDVFAVEVTDAAAFATSSTVLPVPPPPVNAFHRPVRKSPIDLTPSMMAAPMLPRMVAGAFSRPQISWPNWSRADAALLSAVLAVADTDAAAVYTSSTSLSSGRIPPKMPCQKLFQASVSRSTQPCCSRPTFVNSMSSK